MISSAFWSVMSSFRSRMFSPVLGWTSLLAASRPTIRSANEGNSSPFCGSAIHCPAVLLKSNYIMCGIDKPPGEIAALRRPQGSISQTFAGAVGRDEVFQGAKPFTEARFDRKVDNSAGGVGHQTTHPCHLAYLGNITLSAGVCHHVNTAEAVKTLGNCLGNLISSVRPDPDDLTVPFVFSD